jgi:hypothetical protein
MAAVTESDEVLGEFATAPLVCAVMSLEVVGRVAELTAPSRSRLRSLGSLSPFGCEQVLLVGHRRQLNSPPR